MAHWWVAEMVLTASAWWASQRLIQTGRSASFLAAVCFALLGLASAIGALKYGFQWQDRLDDMHTLASRAFGVAGLYLLAMALLDWIGWLRLHRKLWLAHLADALLVFILGYWLTRLPLFQLVIGLVLTLVCIAVAGALWYRTQRVQSGWLALAAVVFSVNGLLVGGGMEPLLGLPVRMDVFHLGLAFWAVCMIQVLAYPADPQA
ncbi:DUF6962 family protein [Saccharospirillum impatiens]|uniref:DUF6962 family protein n=1 Tax=Saccharospirillum impatiens TaxID=169438 RepID=UPI0004294DC7|nr:hypothetical protein [Saccharospirillum impatiens]